MKKMKSTAVVDYIINKVGVGKSDKMLAFLFHRKLVK
jgi:hypothetical protein